MAHESFEDDATASVMNQLFVNVKVDREERPDVDAVYMDAVQALTGLLHTNWGTVLWRDVLPKRVFRQTHACCR